MKLLISVTWIQMKQSAETDNRLSISTNGFRQVRGQINGISCKSVNGLPGVRTILLVHALKAICLALVMLIIFSYFISKS